MRHDSPNVDELVALHAPEKIRERLEGRLSPSYLSDFIYGAIDGAVTTFAIVSGVAGAGMPSGVIIVLGIANLVGDGFSMAASNFLGTRADDQLLQKARQMEERHIRLNPKGEREEVRQIFARKGFRGRDLEHIVDVIASDRKRWIETMLVEELGLQLNARSPIRAASTTFIAFLVVGLIPLLVFLLEYFFVGSVRHPYAWSCAITALAFFGVGAAKSRFVQQHWLSAGAETLALGGGAAFLAYAIGMALRGIVQ